MATKADNISPARESASATERVRNAAHDAIDQTAEKAESIERQVRARADKAGDKLEASHQAATEQVEQSIEQVEAFIKERPMAAAGIAFAAGVITTALLRR